MTDHPITTEVLLADLAGELDLTTARFVANHVATCETCKMTVEYYRTVADVVRGDASLTLPPQTVQRAKALFNAGRFTVTESVLAPIRRVLAQLTFDSRGGLTPALAGFRGEASGYQIAFAGAGAEVDLQIEAPTRLDEPWHLLGQIALTDETPAMMVEIAKPGEVASVARTAADEFGMFSLEVPAGQYDFVVTLPEFLLVLPNLEVG